MNNKEKLNLKDILSSISDDIDPSGKQYQEVLKFLSDHNININEEAKIKELYDKINDQLVDLALQAEKLEKGSMELINNEKEQAYLNDIFYGLIALMLNNKKKEAKA